MLSGSCIPGSLELFIIEEVRDDRNGESREFGSSIADVGVRGDDMVGEFHRRTDVGDEGKPLVDVLAPQLVIQV